MIRESEGIVVKLKGDCAVVMPTAHSGCEASHCCQGDGVSKANVEMFNNVNASIGQKVIFTSKESNLLLAAFIVYFLPLLLIFFGALIGYSISTSVNLNYVLTSVIGGLIAFLISIVIIKSYDKFASSSRKLKPEIIRLAQ